MNRWRAAGLALGVAGLVDAAYLTSESLNPSIPLYCPSSGLINCGTVTSSVYSHMAGIPVAVLGLAWFAVALAIVGLNKPSLNYLLLPLWAAGVAFAGYLIFAEVFLLHAICPYCTFAHIVAILMGLPFAKMVLGEEGE